MIGEKTKRLFPIQQLPGAFALFSDVTSDRDPKLSTAPGIYALSEKGLLRGGLALDFHLLLLPFELLARILLAPSQISTNPESIDNVPQPCSYDRSHPERVIALRI